MSYELENVDEEMLEQEEAAEQTEQNEASESSEAMGYSPEFYKHEYKSAMKERVEPEERKYYEDSAVRALRAGERVAYNIMILRLVSAIHNRR